MQVQTVNPNQLITYAITGVVVAIILFFRIRRMSRARPLILERLWIMPVIYLLFAIFVFRQFPPAPMTWLYCGVALLLGAALGWQRGKMMRISVDPQTHALNHQPSPAAILFIVALIVVRLGAREAAQMSGSALHLNTLVVTDVLISMALGLFAAQRLEMYLRATRLLQAARTA
ncbi:CcdC protein domain-containing protein [Sphingomonas sp. ERG5]|uniref:CcdC protein domain-containing protein n=1 Tax=Sphingomonas sp. ERG5 TaxID=1381597 RepID=UPI00054B5002|nr:CcdC protein domain-containing protein [Sphingomonas sp. ERG5]